MMQLDAETEKRLTELAAIQNISVEELIASFALDGKAALRARIQQSIQQIEDGEFTEITSDTEADTFFDDIKKKARASLNVET